MDAHPFAFQQHRPSARHVEEELRLLLWLYRIGLYLGSAREEGLLDCWTATNVMAWHG